MPRHSSSAIRAAAQLGRRDTRCRVVAEREHEPARASDGEASTGEAGTFTTTVVVTDGVVR